MQVARTFLRPFAVAHNYTSVRLSGGLADFFEAGRDPKSTEKIVYGTWSGSQLDEGVFSDRSECVKFDTKNFKMTTSCNAVC